MRALIGFLGGAFVGFRDFLFGCPNSLLPALHRGFIDTAEKDDAPAAKQRFVVRFFDDRHDRNMVIGRGNWKTAGRPCARRRTYDPFVVGTFVGFGIFAWPPLLG